MHLYFLKINEGQIDKIISECSIQIREVFYMIFSLDGIFKLSQDANVLYKMNCKDTRVEYSNICGFDVAIDKSEIDYTTISYQIPFKHIQKRVASETYLLRAKSDLKFIVMRDLDNNKILDYYFSFNGCINNALFKEDVLTFLSKIK
jgi:hypothetical protein